MSKKKKDRHLFCHTYHHVVSHHRGRRHPGRPTPPPPPSFTSRQLAGLYGYPIPTGPLPTVAILELGGGYEESDLASFASWTNTPIPNVTNLSVQGASNVPGGDANGADGEVALDMQNVIGATCGLAPLLMVWAPNTNAGFAAGVQAVADNAVQHNIASLSISWGQYEQAWAPSDLAAMEAAFVACAAAGVSVFAASGDSGSDDDGRRGDIDVDYPASSPNVFGCGGTTARLVNGVLQETAWIGSGGGFSIDYQKPTWQTGNGGNMRGVPDGAALADPNTGYRVWVDGQPEIIGGTSGAAPMWAALAAILSGAKGKKLGPFAPFLYAAGKDTTDIVAGTNGQWHAGPGWDPVTGMGTPLAAAMLGSA